MASGFVACGVWLGSRCLHHGAAGSQSPSPRSGARHQPKGRKVAISTLHGKAKNVVGGE